MDRASTPVRSLIVDASAITDIDYSAARSIRDLLDDLKRKGIIVAFARVSSYQRSDLHRHRIATVIGENKIFATLHEAIDAVRGTTSERTLRGQ